MPGKWRKKVPPVLHPKPLCRMNSWKYLWRAFLKSCKIKFFDSKSKEEDFRVFSSKCLWKLQEGIRKLMHSWNSFLIKHLYRQEYPRNPVNVLGRLYKELCSTFVFVRLQIQMADSNPIKFSLCIIPVIKLKLSTLSAQLPFQFVIALPDWIYDERIVHSRWQIAVSCFYFLFDWGIT